MGSAAAWWQSSDALPTRFAPFDAQALEQRHSRIRAPPSQHLAEHAAEHACSEEATVTLGVIGAGPSKAFPRSQYFSRFRAPRAARADRRVLSPPHILPLYVAPKEFSPGAPRLHRARPDMMSVRALTVTCPQPYPCHSHSHSCTRLVSRATHGDPTCGVCSALAWHRRPFYRQSTPRWCERHGEPITARGSPTPPRGRCGCGARGSRTRATASGA